MHRIILNLGGEKECDHKNGDGLDNRRENLRICSHRENQFNRKKSKNNISGYKGVSWSKKSRKWRTCIQINNKTKHLGLFIDKIQAAIIYNKAAKNLYGKFANLNKIK